MRVCVLNVGKNRLDRSGSAFLHLSLNKQLNLIGLQLFSPFSPVYAADANKVFCIVVQFNVVDYDALLREVRCWAAAEIS